MLPQIILALIQAGYGEEVGGVFVIVAFFVMAIGACPCPCDPCGGRL